MKDIRIIVTTATKKDSRQIVRRILGRVSSSIISLDRVCYKLVQPCKSDVTNCRYLYDKPQLKSVEEGTMKLYRTIWLLLLVQLPAYGESFSLKACVDYAFIHKSTVKTPSANRRFQRRWSGNRSEPRCRRFPFPDRSMTISPSPRNCFPAKCRDNRVP